MDVLTHEGAPAVANAAKPHDVGSTTTTTSTSVVVPPMSQPARYNEWDVVSLLVGGAVVLTTLIGGLLGIVQFFRSKAREQKEDKKIEDAPLENRVKQLEESVRNFRTVDELEKDFSRLNQKVDHNKENASMMTSGLNSRIDRLHDRQNEETKSRVRLETQIESMALNTQRIEAAIERQGERFDERFDRIHALLSTRNQSM